MALEEILENLIVLAFQIYSFGHCWPEFAAYRFYDTLPITHPKQIKGNPSLEYTRMPVVLSGCSIALAAHVTFVAMSFAVGYGWVVGVLVEPSMTDWTVWWRGGRA